MGDYKVIVPSVDVVETQKKERENARETLLRSIALSLGNVILEAMDDEEVTEIALNPDGSLCLDTFRQGMIQIGMVKPEDGELAIRAC